MMTSAHAVREARLACRTAGHPGHCMERPGTDGWFKTSSACFMIPTSSEVYASLGFLGQIILSWGSGSGFCVQARKSGSLSARETDSTLNPVVQEPLAGSGISEDIDQECMNWVA